jgi:hypothetical protein
MATEVPNEDLKNTAMQLKDIENYTTSATLISQIEKDYQEVCAEFKNDSDFELFKMKFETSYNTLKE